MSSIGPSLPPHLQKARAATPSSRIPDQEPVAGPSRSSAGPARPAVGPSLPPHLLAARRRQSASPERLSVAPQPYPDDDDDDDEVGPSIHLAARPSDQADGVREFLEREERVRKEKEEAAKPKVLERESWMLKPPEASSIASAFAEPSKQFKARGFSSKPAEPVKAQDQTLWTETPAERQKRMQDELSGKKRKAEGAVGPVMDEAELAAMKRRRQRDEEIQRGIQQHNASHRAAPLLETHASSKPKADDKDAAPVIWDRDLHMGVKGRLMDEKDRHQAIKDAKALGDRFGHGRGGAYV